MPSPSPLPRVVVTGIGLLTPLGLNREDSFARALRGEGAVTAAPADIARWLPQALSASVDPAFTARLTKNEEGLDRATQFALVACREALQDAQRSAECGAQAEAWPYPPERRGVFVGIGMGGATTIEALHTRFQEQVQRAANSNGAVSPLVMHPLSVPRLMANAAAAGISMAHQMRGPSHTYSTACASSALALGEALRSIRHGYADAITVVGTEAMINPGSFVAWNALRVMAKPHPSGAVASCRPFDKDRSGFALGEGAAALVLERADLAELRGAKVYAELSGYGSSSDASHLTLSSREGQVRAIRMALDDAGLAPTDIHYLNAHGTATQAGDLVEVEALHEVFGAHIARLPVSSTKSLHGHLSGAGGAVELALTVLSLQRGSIPPTAYLEVPDPRCVLDHVAGVARHGQTLGAAMSNSFAFGGTNVSLVVKAHP